MKHFVGNGVVLHILEDGLVSLPVNVEVDDVGLRREEDLLEVLGRSGEVDLILTIAVHHTRNQFSFAQSLSILFPYVLAKRTAQ